MNVAELTDALRDAELDQEVKVWIDDGGVMRLVSIKDIDCSTISANITLNAF